MLVIGGGITGAGVALDAVTRGLRTALVERDDFASGTSSKSSKLIHGGLRYLQNGDVRLVYEALHERQRLLRNAPHLVRVLPFMIPVLTKDGVDLAQDRPRARNGDVDVRPDRRVADRQAAPAARGRRRVRPPARRCPRERLASAYLYYDAATDDARLTLAVVRTAARHGAVVANRCRGHVVHPRRRRAHRRRRGRHRRRRGHDPRPSRRQRHRCVDRRGPRPRRASPTPTRSDRRRASTSPCRGTRSATTSPSSSPCRTTSAACSSCRGATPDGTFEHTYIGTTDTDYDGPLDDPQCTDDDVDYVLRRAQPLDHDRRHAPTT